MSEHPPRHIEDSSRPGASAVTALGRVARQEICEGVLATVAEYARPPGLFAATLPPVQWALGYRLWNKCLWCGQNFRVKASVLDSIGAGSFDHLEDLLSGLFEQKILRVAKRVVLVSHRQGVKRPRRNRKPSDRPRKRRTHYKYEIAFDTATLFPPDTPTGQRVLSENFLAAPPPEFGGLALARMLEPDAFFELPEDIVTMAEKKVFCALLWEPNYIDDVVTFKVSRLAELLGNVHRTTVVAGLRGLQAEKIIELDDSRPVWWRARISNPYSPERILEWERARVGNTDGVSRFAPLIFRFADQARAPEGISAHTPPAEQPPPRAPEGIPARTPPAEQDPPRAPEGIPAHTPPAEQAPPADPAGGESHRRESQIAATLESYRRLAEEEARKAQELRKDHDLTRGRAQDPQDVERAPFEDQDLVTRILATELILIRALRYPHGIFSWIFAALAAMKEGVAIDWVYAPGLTLCDADWIALVGTPKRPGSEGEPGIVGIANTQPKTPDKDGNCAKAYFLGAVAKWIAEIHTGDKDRAEQLVANGDSFKCWREVRSALQAVGYPWAEAEMWARFDPDKLNPRFNKLRRRGG